MSLKTLMLGIAVAGITARLYSKSRQARRAGEADAGSGQRAGAGASRLSASTARATGEARETYSPPQRPAAQPTLAQPHWQQAGSGLDSPNAAERLEAGNRAGSPTGEDTPMARAGEGDDLFDSSSQRGPGPTTTGLPDFTRGA